MPSAEEHRRISQRNEAFFEQIGGVDALASDWAMTVLFYATHHELAALIRERNLDVPEDHRDMKRVLRDQGWNDLAITHATLLSRSHRARYKGSRYLKTALEDSRRLLHELRVKIAELPEAEATNGPTAGTGTPRKRER